MALRCGSASSVLINLKPRWWTLSLATHSLRLAPVQAPQTELRSTPSTCRSGGLAMKLMKERRRQWSMRQAGMLTSCSAGQCPGKRSSRSAPLAILRQLERVAAAMTNKHGFPLGAEDGATF